MRHTMNSQRDRVGEKNLQRPQQQPPPATQPSPVTQPLLSLPPGKTRRPSSKCQHRDNKVIIVPSLDNTLHGTMAADGYILGSWVDSGSYSKVRMVTKSLPGNKTVQLACKQINKTLGLEGHYDQCVPREMEVLCAIRHPHLIRTHRIYKTPTTTFVITDFCELGDLDSHLRFNKNFPQWQAHTFFKQMCDAVEYLHRNEICHRDIKCENVLLENVLHVKLTEFGFARKCTDERGRRLMSRTVCGSLAYGAPEMLQGKPYYLKPVDVWALGVLLYRMLADTVPYPNSNVKQVVYNQLRKRSVKPNRPMAPDALNLIQTILEPDIKKRATLEKIKNHKWIKQSILTQ